MLNRKAWLALVRFRTRKVRLILPLSLVAVEDTLNALADLTGVFSPLVRLPQGLKITDLLVGVSRLISGIRSYPGLNLVKVEADDVWVQVDLY